MGRFEVGQIVRYDRGASALMRLETRRDVGRGHYRWYGSHVLGGSWGEMESDIRPAEEADLEFARTKRPEWFNRIPSSDAVKKSSPHTS